MEYINKKRINCIEKTVYAPLNERRRHRTVISTNTVAVKVHQNKCLVSIDTAGYTAPSE